MKTQRQNEIIQLLTEQRMVKVCDLVERFDVSTETIRRDLEYLEKKGHLSRIYGGATIKTMRGQEPEYAFRETKNYDIKIAIGRRAAELVEDGDTIIIDLGTTTLEFSRFLHTKKNLTVFTNSIQIASELVKSPEIRVFLLGGELRHGELATSGYLAEQMIDLFHVDKLFMGVGALTLKRGIEDYQVEEANLRRHFIKQSQIVIALADYSKFGVRALNHVCNLDKLDILVTDGNTDEKMLTAIRQQSIKTLIAT